MAPWSQTRLALVGMPVLVSLCAPCPAYPDAWTDPTPEEFAMSQSGVEPGADAEALLWEITVDDSRSDTVIDHYLRVKVFTPGGVERYSTVSISHSRRSRVTHVEGRTVGPDGTVSKLKGDAVFKTTDVKSSEGELRSTTFALPNVTIGSIVEYRYRETRFDWAAHYVDLYVQLDVPAALVRYNIKPFPSPSHVMRYVAQNAAVPRFKLTTGGFYTTSIPSVRAFVEEPFSPPEGQLRGSIIVYYARGSEKSPDEFWKDIGTRSGRWFDEETRPNRDMKELAASIAGEGARDTVTLRKLFDWCRTRVANLTNDGLEGRPVAEDADRPIRKVADVLRRRAGTESDINLLFGALARAAGFEVRLAMAASRNRRSFEPSLMVPIALDHSLIAVRLNSQWRLFDPGARLASFGELRWPHAGSSALLCDGAASAIIETALAPPERSTSARSARFTLDASGTLEGEAHVVLTGHSNERRRTREADQSLKERQRKIVDRVHERLPTAELSEVRIADDLPDTTLRHEEWMLVRVPDYATRIGGRLLLQPAFFEKGSEPVFTSNTRRYPVCFGYPWLEVDTVRIALPEGYVVEAADQPKPIQIPGVAEYIASVRLSQDAREIIYVRRWRFGNDGMICFPKDSYAGLKQAFDLFHERDGLTLTLRRVEGD